MKKIVILAVLAVTMFSCSKKMAASKSTPVVVVEAAPKKSEVEVNNAVMVASGQKLFVGKCARCHALKDPALYTKQEWVGHVNEMAPKANATDDEKAQILAYVQYNAKDAVK